MTRNVLLAPPSSQLIWQIIQEQYSKVRAQQLIIQVVTWDYFYLVLICSNTAYQGARSGIVVKALNTNRQDAGAGSIPDGVIGIFQWHNPSGHTMALGSTQPLMEMSTSCISWGKRPVRKADNLTTIQCRCHEIWEP